LHALNIINTWEYMVNNHLLYGHISQEQLQRFFGFLTHCRDVQRIIKIVECLCVMARNAQIERPVTECSTRKFLESLEEVEMTTEENNLLIELLDKLFDTGVLCLEARDALESFKEQPLQHPAAPTVLASISQDSLGASAVSSDVETPVNPGFNYMILIPQANGNTTLTPDIYHDQSSSSISSLPPLPDLLPQTTGFNYAVLLPPQPMLMVQELPDMLSSITLPPLPALLFNVRPTQEEYLDEVQLPPPPGLQPQKRAARSPEKI
jgi:hypothetical protein